MQAAAPSVQFTIVLHQQNTHVLEERALAVSTPGSRQYGRYLSQAAIDELLRPSELDRSTVTEWLDRHRIAYTIDRELIRVRTSAARAASAL